MKNWWNRKYAVIALYGFLAAAAVVALIFAVLNFPTFLSFFYNLLGILAPFIVGFAIAYLLNPGYRFFRQKVYGKLFEKKPKPRLTKILSLLTIYLIVLGIVVFLLSIVVPQLYKSIETLVRNIESYYNEFNALIESWGLNEFINLGSISETIDIVTKWVIDYIKNINLDDLQNVMDVTVSVASGVFSFVIGLIASVYMLYNKELFCAQVKKMGYAIFPKKFMYKLQRLLGISNQTFSKYLSGVLIDALVVGTTCFIVMQIANIPYAILIGVMVGITNMIPFFGPYIGGVPSVLLVLMVDPIKAIWVVVILVVLQQLDGNFLTPKIAGQRTGMSALWVMIAIIVGGGFFGVIGMLIAVPVCSVVFSVTKSFMNERLKNKNMSAKTAAYYADAEVSAKYTPDEEPDTLDNPEQEQSQNSSATKESK